MKAVAMQPEDTPLLGPPTLFAVRAHPQPAVAVLPIAPTLPAHCSKATVGDVSAGATSSNPSSSTLYEVTHLQPKVCQEEASSLPHLEHEGGPLEASASIGSHRKRSVDSWPRTESEGSEAAASRCQSKETVDSKTRGSSMETSNKALDTRDAAGSKDSGGDPAEAGEEAESRRGSRGVPEEEGSRFWKPALSRLYALYFRQRLHLLVEVLAQLTVEQWRQLFDFAGDLKAFLNGAPEQPPQTLPEFPAGLLACILASCGSGEIIPMDGASEVPVPRCYLEVALFLRLLWQPSSSRGSAKKGFRAPSRVSQFFIQFICSSAAAAFLFTLGALQVCGEGANGAAGKNWRGVPDASWLHDALCRAWVRHAGDLMLACQHVLVRLYPTGEDMLLHSSKRPLDPGDIPSLTAVLLASACQLSAQFMLLTCEGVSVLDGCLGSHTGGVECPPATQSRPPSSSIDVEVVGGDSRRQQQHFAQILLHALAACRQGSSSGCSTTDKFLMALRDVLNRHLGPCPASPADLPDIVPALPNGLGDPDSSFTSPDIKTLARIIRRVIQAYIDPAHLAASAAEVSSEEDHLAGTGSGSVNKSSFVGPLPPGDFVPVPETGPLRRSLTFMEHSALLQAVQSKLCAARFDDVVGSTEQLSHYALRHLRVLWFDVRRCTSNLKKDLSAEASGAGRRGGGRVVAVQLVLRHLRLGLEHDWEAKLASLPYVQVEGRSQIKVGSLSITIHMKLSQSEGVSFGEVQASLPHLDVHLTCSSIFSQVVLSTILRLFQASLQDHIKGQLRRVVLQMLRHEAKKWNASMWKSVTRVVPDSLIAAGLEWMATHIPPEGLPI